MKLSEVIALLQSVHDQSGDQEVLTVSEESRFEIQLSPGSPYETHRVLVISTLHLSEKVANDMDHSGPPGVIVYGKDEYGWWVCRSLDPTPLPPELEQVMALADRLKCSWVMFDRDGPVYNSLPMFEW